jgi:hypothetical protein
VTTNKVDELFEQFVTEYGHGRNPDVREYLDRAGPTRSELGALIDSYLAFAPIGETDEESLILVSARVAGRTPIAEARTRRNLSVTALVEKLREQLGLATGLSDRLQEAYDDLERDWLDPKGVHSTVWDALRTILGIDVRSFVGSGGPPVAGVLMRRDSAEAKLSPMAASRGPAGPQDDVDRLFRGNR